GGVEWSFGKPYTIGETTIITVAKTSFAIGGGGGSSPIMTRKSKKSKSPETGQAIPEPENDTVTPEPDSVPLVNEGGGGGGGLKTEPIGLFIVKGDKVRFYPVIGLKEFAAIFGLVSLLLFRLIRKVKKK
ncbi:MAG: spore germination protein GerW family protein, partial [Candidatus Cloacimonadaceae bacterium]|nr:spore germination protein GerW family protein [Candidatus Cloacimonadaceae bacterium]